MITIRTFNTQELEHYCTALTSTDTYNGKQMANHKTIKGYRTYHRSWSLSVPNLYLWSDQHFGHSKIIDYAERPFDSVENMNQTLQNNLHSVSPDSWVLFGGDVAFGNAGFSQLTCDKSLYIIGNHDMHHGTLTSFLKHHPYVASGIVINETIAVCHYPVRFEGLQTIHGHIHQYLMDGLHNMCVEHTEYKPQPLSFFIA